MMDSEKKAAGQYSRREFFTSSGKLAGAGLGAMILSNPAGALQAMVPPSDRITVGFIAVGARMHQIIDSMLTIDGIEITRICDAYTGRITRTQERLVAGGAKKAKVAADYREILADKSVDAVIIGTPDHLHAKIAIAAVQAGKDVYIEKPLTYTVDEGLEIIKAVKASGRVFQVGSQGISSPVQRKAREIIQSGKLGQVTMLRAFYNRNTAGGAWIYPVPPDANPSTVNWDMFIGSAPRVPFNLERFFQWRCYTDYSGGIPTDLFVHLCTTIHFLMGVPAPARVMAMGDCYRWKESRDLSDTVNGVLQYKAGSSAPDGFMVNLMTTFNNTAISGQGFQVMGTEGSLAIGGGNTMEFKPEAVMENDRWIVRSWPEAMEKAYYNDPKLIEYEEKTKARNAAVMPEKITCEDVNATTVHMQNFF
ncbi:MAG: Gfo/Idh/MocA family oxidoreductase, partial [Gemmatimonadota bacterium]|nr:Gfo/Idh/MocA family oxidoreductase [Gemmatimonadota bacterium]